MIIFTIIAKLAAAAVGAGVTLAVFWKWWTRSGKQTLDDYRDRRAEDDATLDEINDDLEHRNR